MMSTLARTTEAATKSLSSGTSKALAPERDKSVQDAAPATQAPLSRSQAAVLQLQRSHGNRHVQRMVALARQAEGEPEVAPEVEAAIERERGGGQALDRSARAEMEPFFGTDFSGVRIHTGAQADTLNRALSAHAFTTGRDIFFREGEYRPGSTGGRELLAHELTHVLQQGEGWLRTSLVMSQPGDSAEQEASQMAKAVMGSNEHLQRLCTECEEELQPREHGRESVSRSAGSGGAPHTCCLLRLRDRRIAGRVARQTSKAGGADSQAVPVHLDELMWRNEIKTEVKLQGGTYHTAVAEAIALMSLPPKYDDAMGIFLNEAREELGKFALGLLLKDVPGSSLATSVVDAIRSASKKIEGKAIDNTFAAFKDSASKLLHDGIAAMTSTENSFNERIQDLVISKASAVSDLNRLPATDEAKQYAGSMQRFIQREVSRLMSGNPEANFNSQKMSIVDYLPKAFDYFLLARLEVMEGYRRCRSRLQQEGSVCPESFFGWDEDCLHKHCKQWLVYSPMQPGWTAPNELWFTGPTGGWREVSTGEEHPAGRASVPAWQWEREKARYKK